MKYLIIGTGGTGGCIGGYLASSGKDVAFIARGNHLKAIKENGLIVHSTLKGEINLENVKVFDGDQEFGKFDVIFLCVKGYSLNETISTIKKASHAKTIIIPILNALNAGEQLSEALPGITVLDGCIYVGGYISAPGEITQTIKIFRVVFGARENTKVDIDVLYKVQLDLEESGIDGIISDNIRCDIFKKISFTSAYAATGAYYDAAAGEFQKDGECRKMFILLLKELQKVAIALNIKLDTDFIDENLVILSGFSSDTTASMQKDIKTGKSSEKDELIFNIVNIAEKYGIGVPNYKKIANHFGYIKSSRMFIQRKELM
ncbi:2-dehydropantoate 2-reductase [Clostridium estertheticum]|uniref:2-dehydropantoate 2-reductase n=1 Tax=Clostridium estertheticum TaxID=238834 RepID=A0AA47EFL7_9CLOT|nr:2-dehydropantoate 2-reductase [Clostridium estertheticum]MBU3155985.1 2-dehydropantoate 2-reductase [Clostridium estertheticum]MBU3200598.1 2-dehydropantoate 2-reductase [Clostridium estertheticum]WAG59111.1 2-dehydropantoate 2-reductase [Clostridium estertheticum]WAG66837.1 2-dehydropantoate 2-reductase [Clostridium estertheticum]